MTPLYIGVAVVVLVGVYVWLRKSKHNEANLPAVSEDVNLPKASEPNPPAMSQPNSPMMQPNTPPANEQSNNNQPPQQQQ